MPETIGHQPEQDEFASGQELQELNQQEEISEAEIEQRIDRLLEDDVAATELMGKIHAAREQKRPEANYLVLEMKRLREYARTEVEQKLGIHKSKAEQEQEEAEEHRRNMQEILSTVDGDEDEQEFLAKLGMLNPEGRFEYPDQLFTPHTNHLWQTYLKTVSRSMAAMNLANEYGIRSEDVFKLDRLRVDAHDQVSDAVRAEMNYTLNFDEARSLVAKMREMSIPNSGELKTTARAAWDLVETARRKYPDQKSA